MNGLFPVWIGEFPICYRFLHRCKQHRMPVNQREVCGGPVKTDINCECHRAFNMGRAGYWRINRSNEHLGRSGSLSISSTVGAGIDSRDA